MPFKSRAQQRFLFATDPVTAKRWAAHTPDFSKLPEKVKKPNKDAETVKDDTIKKAFFVLGFLEKCAAEGLTTPAQIADAAEKLTEKPTEKLAGLGDVLGGATGTLALGAAAGIGIPTALGYAGGRAIGAAGNQMDKDDADSLKLRAEANAYRRRAAEARLGAQVRKIVATDPKKYVVLS